MTDSENEGFGARLIRLTFKTAAIVLYILIGAFLVAKVLRITFDFFMTHNVTSIITRFL